MHKTDSRRFWDDVGKYAVMWFLVILLLVLTFSATRAYIHSSGPTPAATAAQQSAKKMAGVEWLVTEKYLGKSPDGPEALYLNIIPVYSSSALARNFETPMTLVISVGSPNFFGWFKVRPGSKVSMVFQNAGNPDDENLADWLRISKYTY